MTAITLHLKQRIRKYPESLSKKALKSLKLAADWAVRNQVQDEWPAWNANKGRLPYHMLIDPKKRSKKPLVLSTCWKTSRAAQGLYSAYQVTGNEAYLGAANLAMDYVATLQVFEPGAEIYHGAFREDSPLGAHVASRDGMEAVQGFIAGYQVTKSERYLQRAIAGTDFLIRLIKKGIWPFGLGWPDKGTFRSQDSFCFYAGALVFVQMYLITGQRQYLTEGVIPWADRILIDFVREDGAFTDGSSEENIVHTATKGELAGVVVNDDGLGIALLAAYNVTGKKKYLDAAIGSADFWIGINDAPPKLAAYPCVAILLADVYRITGDKKYLPRITEYIEKIISLQCHAPKDSQIHGCFIGEDLAKLYDKKTVPTDYVDLRITSYSLIALSKVAAQKTGEWGCSYSGFYRK